MVCNLRLNVVLKAVILLTGLSKLPVITNYNVRNQTVLPNPGASSGAKRLLPSTLSAEFPSIQGRQPSVPTQITLTVPGVTGTTYP
jgi:hypothetical protein